jgi:hypothetical protein
MKCTGRDELCNEVLNDVWVSFPTWSEDSVFLSSKKNVYEEALYKCEDERYEIDRIIEANCVTIKVLESISNKMSNMTNEELSRFHLNSSLNGTSECIYNAAIRRIYGERSNEIIESLKANPYVTVPVVLQRMKQKDEEWHRIKVRKPCFFFYYEPFQSYENDYCVNFKCSHIYIYAILINLIIDIIFFFSVNGLKFGQKFMRRIIIKLWIIKP